MKKSKGIQMPYEKRKSLYGYGFIALWLVGTIKWFLIPLITSLKYSFETVTPATGGVQESWVGFQNYVYAFGVDPNYSKY